MNPLYTKIILITVGALFFTFFVFIWFYYFRYSELQMQSEFPIVYNRCPDTWLEYRNNCVYMDSSANVKDISSNDPDFKTFLSTSGSNLGTNNGNIGNVVVLKESLQNNLYYKKTEGTFLENNQQKFDVFKFKNYMTKCDKKKWAKKNGIVWDGITNYTFC